MPRTARPGLAVVRPEPSTLSPQPPANLGPTGRALWASIVAGYEFSDAGSIETLAQACSAADRAAELATQIDADGVMIHTKFGGRDHPCLKHELAARAFVVRSLARLGLDLEPVRATTGRPPFGGAA